MSVLRHTLTTRPRETRDRGDSQKGAGHVLRSVKGDQHVGVDQTTGADLILDAALTEAQQDRFDHEAIAGVVADLTLNATPPVDIALFGPGGSGKSSFFGLLNQRISESDQSVKVARYDAWKYGGRALKTHFVGSVAEQFGLGGDEFEQRLAHDLFGEVLRSCSVA